MRSEEVVHYATDAQREERSQVVHIPARLQERRGRYNHVIRTALVKGSCLVHSSYLPLATKPVAFGIVTSYERFAVVVCKSGDDH